MKHFILDYGNQTWICPSCGYTFGDMNEIIPSNRHCGNPECYVNQPSPIVSGYNGPSVYRKGEGQSFSARLLCVQLGRGHNGVVVLKLFFKCITPGKMRVFFLPLEIRYGVTSKFVQTCNHILRATASLGTTVNIQSLKPSEIISWLEKSGADLIFKIRLMRSTSKAGTDYTRVACITDATKRRIPKPAKAPVLEIRHKTEDKRRSSYEEDTAREDGTLLLGRGLD